MQVLNVSDVKSIFFHIKTLVDREKENLTALDSAMGDGDLGITMARAFSAAQEEADKSDETMPGKLLIKLGMTMAKASPSTMGTLLATGFARTSVPQLGTHLKGGRLQPTIWVA